MVKRKKYTLRKGDVLEVYEFHEGNYGAAGQTRTKRKKPTKEQVQKINRLNKERRCRHRLLEYFDQGDVFATWTYKVDERPENMEAALKDFRSAMQRVRREYKKRGHELRWIRNIEQGSRGAWHIHLVINEIGDTVAIIQKAWRKGGTWSEQIGSSQYYDKDMSKLAAYLTKDEHTPAKTGNNLQGSAKTGKHRLQQANYNSSRNMPLPEPKEDILIRWKEEPKPKKGYYIAKCVEGISPFGYKYRRYTMYRIEDKPRKRNKVPRGGRIT